MKRFLPVLTLLFSHFIFGQYLTTDPKVYDIINDVSAERLESDVRKLAGFGTRNTLSDTVSNTRGIGAARRWIKSEFDQISKTNALEFLSNDVP